MSTQRYKFPLILLLVLLMVTAVVIMGQSLQQNQAGATATTSTQAPRDERYPIRGEAGVFSGLKQASRFVDTDMTATRSLVEVYDRRAYPGAPPHIPHPIDQDMKTDFDICASCHAKGGYVPQWKAYAPVTPHPDYANCRQCHVPKSQAPLFAKTHWRKPEPPVLGRAMLPGGPPPIPHELQMRENCSACHTGPAAPLEIRTSHPERVYCRQCHVPTTASTLFTRETR